MLKIYYHGTNQKSAKQILKTGFNKGTYFADHLEDALGFGGNHIFSVAIDFQFGRGRRSKSFSWQVVSANKIPAEKIVEYKIYQKPKKIFSNEKLRKEVFNSN